MKVPVVSSMPRWPVSPSFRLALGERPIPSKARRLLSTSITPENVLVPVRITRPSWPGDVTTYPDAYRSYTGIAVDKVDTTAKTITFKRATYYIPNGIMHVDFGEV